MRQSIANGIVKIEMEGEEMALLELSGDSTYSRAENIGQQLTDYIRLLKHANRELAFGEPEFQVDHGRAYIPILGRV